MKTIAAVLSFVALSFAGAVTTACSSTEGITPEPTTDGGAVAPGAEPTRGPNDPVSGSRLLVRYNYFQMEDGSKQRAFAGFFDNKLNTMCVFSTTLDGNSGVARCVPVDPEVVKQHTKDEYQIGRVDLSP